MQSNYRRRSLLARLPLADIILWLAPLGRSVRLFAMAVRPSSLQYLTWREFRAYCSWMGIRSFHFVALAAVFVGIALTIQCVIELKKYQAEDLSGAAISIGLLRELGPLTISVAWCVRVAALVSEEARSFKSRYQSDLEFAQKFVMPRYLAALAMSIPLGAYGLVVGFVTAALFAPILGVSSTIDFSESARQAIKNKDLVVYFVKLIAINPTVGVFAGCACGLMARGKSEPVAANAVTATFLACFAFNLAITFAAYLYGEPIL